MLQNKIFLALKLSDFVLLINAKLSIVVNLTSISRINFMIN